MVKKYNSQTVMANVLLAHGSRDKSWKKPFEELLEKCVNRSPEKTFCLCYLELCDPKLEEVVKCLADDFPKISTIKIHRCRTALLQLLISIDVDHCTAM